MMPRDAVAETNAFYQAPGTRRMAELLEKTVAKANPDNAPFLSSQRAALFGARLAGKQTTLEVIDLMPQYAVELLNAGRTEEAIKAFADLEAMARQHNPDFLMKNQRLLFFYQALCHLRLGEQDNCLATHSSEACLLPIRGGGIHKNQRGSRAGIKVLTEMLERFPDDLEARWLLNIAFMTVGEYPDKVPAKWLIPPKVFASDYDIKPFRNVAGEVGLDVNELSGGSVLEDFDGDGFLDVMVSSIGFHDQMRLFRNNGDGAFAERTREAGLKGETGGLNLIQADYNNDGHPDVLVLRGAWFKSEGRHPNSLLRNNGDGTFADVTEEAGLLSFHPTQTAAWFDYNNDGWIDLFIGNESSGREIHPCELFRNNRDGTFTEVAAESGVAVQAYVKGVAAGDYNNDGLPDLYLSVLNGPNYLFRNDGPQDVPGAGKSRWKFTDVTKAAGVTEPRFSFPTWFFDYDNDGRLDLFVAGYRIANAGDVAADYMGLPHAAERARLYHNNGDGTFTDVTKTARLYRVLLAMGANFGDLDNDGFLDFYLGTGNPDLATLIPNRMFRNHEGQYFEDVTTSGGFGHLQKGHGISFGDIDNDGDQDVHEDMGGAYTGDLARNALYENPGHGSHWITLKLDGVKSNRAGIGARIKVNVKTDQGERAIYRTVSTGGSFGASPLRREIGLGRAQAIQSIEISWPVTGQTQVISNMPMDRFYRVREGESQATPWAVKSYKLAAKPGPASHEHHHPE